MILAGANNYTGGTTVNGGTLQLANASGIPSSGAVTVNSGATLATSNGLACNLNGVVLNNSTLASGTPDPVNGSWSLTGNVQATGTSTISANEVSWGNNNRTFTVVNPADTLYVPVAFAAGGGGGFGGALTMAGSGTMVLTASNMYTGWTTINGGTLQLGDGTANNGSVAGNITNNATLVFANPNAQTYGGTIGGNGTLDEVGTGALTLNIPNSGNTAATNVNQGSLIVGNINVFQNRTGLLTVNSGATLMMSSNQTSWIGGNLALAGGTLTSVAPISGWGSWALAGDVQATGNSMISASDVNWPGGTTRTFTVVNPGDTLNVPGTFATGAGFSGALTKAGAGTMILGGETTTRATPSSAAAR